MESHDWWAWGVWIVSSVALGGYLDLVVADKKKQRARKEGRPWLGKDFNSGILLTLALMGWSGYGFYLPFVRNWSEIIEIALWAGSGLFLVIFVVALITALFQKDGQTSSAVQASEPAD